MKLISLIVLFGLTCLVSSLENGIGRKPPMGWISWARYTCEIDCDKYPDDCIHERLYKRVADELVDGGFAEAGYTFVNVDDCWAEMKRDPKTKKMISDQKRFPSGIKALADYVHGKGLKFGLYTDMGVTTCAGYPGLLIDNATVEADNYFEVDAKSFAEWEIDSIKVDGCFADPLMYDTLYPRFGKVLNSTGRQILYGCSWPLFQNQISYLPDYESIRKHCNVWRNFGDIEDSWKNILGVIDFYGDSNELFAKNQGPGGFFDPDMLVIGNFGLSKHQSRAQMALWSMFSAPLHMSAELRTMTKEDKEILLNKEVIAIDQDERGEMAKRVVKRKDFEVWVKRVEPTIDGVASVAVVYFYRQPLGGPVFFEEKLSDLLKGLPTANSYTLKDLFGDKLESNSIGLSDNLRLKVNPSGSVRMLRLTPVTRGKPIF